ncbi:serine hydrolase [Streptomyces sp. NBC_01506]|uniref:serine hydrolase n=1 Tax=Streptomyces sp. NBC_01506 TaxID=2903887 RepID=UPI00386C5188
MAGQSAADTAADVTSAEPAATSGAQSGSRPDAGPSRPADGRDGFGSGRGPGADRGGHKADSTPANPAEPAATSGTKSGAAPARSAVGTGRESGAADQGGAEPDAGQAGSARSAGGQGAAPAKPGTAPARPAGGRDESGGKGDVAPAGSGAGTGEPGGDRKTAVFKAVQQPRVDQPTAMLKLPPRPPAAAPELPAERTSKFVPLRADQVAPGSGVAEAERTRQQPMPPLPPLDLLAELTNKPAPPETPARTVVRRVKIWTPLLVLVLIIFAVVQVMRPLPAPSLNLTTKSTYTFEGDRPALPWPSEGQGFMAATGLGTVDSFGEQKAVPIGSVAKAMTAYVVLKDKPLKKGAKGPSITVDAKAESDGGLDAQGESTLNTVNEGDKLTQHDALAALMIPSANNIARLLARWDAGSEEAFVKKMNDTAKELGMENTTYTDPSGLDATTVSSAEDQVKLGQKLVEIEALMDITKLPEWTDPSGKSWRNYNTLVPYDGALGIKTGSTTKAGGNLLFAAHKMVGDTDQLVVGAVLGQHKSPIIDTVNAVSKDVMLATQEELDGATIVKKGQVVGEVDNGMGTTAPVVATEDVKAVGWSGLTVKLELTDDGKDLPQSAAAGTHVGTLTVGEGKSQVKVAVALQGDLAEPTFGDKLTRVG